MNIKWKYKEKVIGKSGDLLLTRRSERRHSRQVKAESLIINSVGQRPTERNVQGEKAPKGRNPALYLITRFQRSATQLLLFRRALPDAIDERSFRAIRD